MHQGTLTCAGSWYGRAGCSSSDTGLSLLVVNATFDAVSASFPVELCSELVLLAEQLLFLGMPYDTTPAVSVAVTEKNYSDFKHQQAYLYNMGMFILIIYILVI